MKRLDLYAKLFAGLADPGRLGILLRLRNGSRSAGELAALCGLSPSNASNHLRCLLDCGLVSVEPQGRHNVYRLTDPGVVGVLEASSILFKSPAGRLIRECCNYESGSRRKSRSSLRGPTASLAKPTARRRKANESM